MLASKFRMLLISKRDRHLLGFPVLPCMDCRLEICPPSFSCSHFIRLLSLKFRKDFVYKTILLTMIKFQGTCKMMMMMMMVVVVVVVVVVMMMVFSVQFVADFRRMKFYAVIQSKTHPVP